MVKQVVKQMIDRGMLKQRLKEIIIEECDKDIEPDEIDDDGQLIGGGLDLDSLDALQISLAIKGAYGVRIEGGPQARLAFQSINSLADFIQAELGS